nr:hypothetical protein [Chloroflexota bacterium]
MQKTLIINRYQLNQRMKSIPEANYYSATDMAINKPVTVRTIDISTIGAVGIGLEHLAADKLRLKMENEKTIIQTLHHLAHPSLLTILDDGFDAPLY